MPPPVQEGAPGHRRTRPRRGGRCGCARRAGAARPSSRSSARSRSRRTTRLRRSGERKGRGVGRDRLQPRRRRRASRRTGHTWGSHEERVRRRGGSPPAPRADRGRTGAAWSRRAAPRARAASPACRLPSLGAEGGARPSSASLRFAFLRRTARSLPSSPVAALGGRPRSTRRSPFAPTSATSLEVASRNGAGRATEASRSPSPISAVLRPRGACPWRVHVRA